ncbi:FxsB family cyclophane-forming radical SAM/SPASM peptide maturase [Actinophytocola sp.]|uniref:FxsB family cyclophane-forming radical SAM/SPASM peptide maturase n=1 Tax=Actinophytocola sp. TaxID=1872138 RepID=UPI002D798CF3|nr:FxsB family cyclophane-forming radical SAM/SPASM peptide maturase [Actinophytocola sp.]
MVPITEYVLKVASRCNLSCDYCYVYTMADQSWRSRPLFPSPETVAATARRIGEHAETHGLDFVSIALHGGEPLLAGGARIADVVTAVRRACPPGTAVRARVQTNGVLLDEPMLRRLRAHDVRVGVSIDGGRTQHDRHRRDHGGQGSWDATVSALQLLRDNPDRYSGLLCVIDLANDPVEVYESLLEFAPPTVDFLLPQANWLVPPPRNGMETPFADWLIAVFDRWYGAPRQETGVRLFQEIIHLLLGGDSTSDQVGLSPVAYLVVDTDGSFQQADMLKSTAPGQPETGFNVFDHPVDAVLTHPEVRARQAGIDSLADACRQCTLVRVCGGGNYTHRFGTDHGFRHPSVYCPDLTRLIHHISDRVRSDLAVRPTH